MTQPPPTSEHDPAALQPPPPEVAQAAASRGLGSLVASQRGINPFDNLVFGLGTAIVLVGGGILVAWLGALAHAWVLRFVAIPMIISGLVFSLKAIVSLFAGFTATYLYANGLIHTKNKKIQVVTWSEVDQLWLWKGGGKGSLAGKLLNYYVVTVDGRKVMVEVYVAPGEQPIGAQLEQIVQQLGRPVVDSGPYTGKLRP